MSKAFFYYLYKNKKAWIILKAINNFGIKM
jgi:hypothetical protein